MVKMKKKVTAFTPTNDQARIQLRLSRLEGQVQALRRMVGRGDDWIKLLTLVAAIEGAADRVSADLFQGYLESLTVSETVAKKAREGLELVVKRR
jgi:DNA-binding FrmR family transcriptional regulator